MSDVEEPAAKMSKLEDLAEGEEMDNGQEEWLSEEILTDDDYNTAADQDQSDSIINTSQEEGYTDSMDQVSQDIPNTTGENIERTLNNLENATSTAQDDLPEELGAFLVRKKDVRAVDIQLPPKEPESELDESIKQSEDDGNDTDDLLRMLGEDNSKKKESSASQKPEGARPKNTVHSSDEDVDDYIFEGAQVTKLKVAKGIMKNNAYITKKLKVAKNVVIKKPTQARTAPDDSSDKEVDNDVRRSKLSAMAKLKAMKFNDKEYIRSRRIASKAVPEDLSDLDEESVQSSDEAITMKKMFDVHKTKTVPAGPCGVAPRRRGINAVKTVTKRVISIDPKNGPNITSSAPPHSPAKTMSNIHKKPQLMLRSKTTPSAPPTHTRTLLENSAGHDDLDDEEHFNDDLQDMDSDVDEDGGQRLMEPERMDEEVPSDVDSHSDDDSYYDEMPSSESEDADDWFTLDIRAERAADYIPMLGEDAKTLLTAEQQRAAARLGALRRSANALVTGRRSLAAQLRIARSSLAQLDAALAQ